MRLYTTVGASETIGAAVTAPSTKMAVVLPVNSTWQLLAFRGTQEDGETLLQLLQLCYGVSERMLQRPFDCA
jgi:hypothetical protein